jgi:2-oxoglutarate dehydrogenase E1 component
MEETENRIHLSREDQIRILTKLTDAVMFEEFLQTKYIGAKIFSLEGSESLIPLLNFAIERAADSGVNEVVLAMAHRGRLNVLANIMGKSPHEIFREFEDRDPELFLGSGDVKYHLGYRSKHDTSTGKTVDLSLCFNPSHLEYVNPVALGRTRARQDRDPLRSRNEKLTILVHGDAALAGEGIGAETLNLGELFAYTTGGAIHIVINNQIGFTTPPQQGRSATYATDVAKMLDIPIFHVNGEDPEAVTQVICLAVDFRKRFGRDVFIDMYGYRRHGHNEGDEPAFTQPLLYAAISRRKSVRDGYLEHLLRLGGVTREEAEQIAIDRHRVLEGELSYARSNEYVRANHDVPPIWQGYRGGAFGNDFTIDTTVSEETAKNLLTGLTQLPQGFKPHRKIERLLEQRLEMAKGEKKLDWGAGESLAFASLLTTGTPIRFTGQDCERGTFSHRHAAIHNVETGEKYFPLAHLSKDQARIEIYNSALSEAAVLGFEYGYSLECPDWLVLWEAQFGDFWNVAQVVVDQFIVSAEDKWKQLSGITLLLPHGYEGMGPEHSSARIERWMMLAAEDNIQICQPSTPAQMFHLLRRQALAKWRKPLVVFTPKSLLRHPKATSLLSEFTTGKFEPIIDDEQLTAEEAKRVKRVLLCTGKAYYTLQQSREELNKRDTAIVRIEQLYPLSDAQLQQMLERYPVNVPVVWVQEEPENMGAWRHFRARFGANLWGRNSFECVARAESASPATGSSGSHRIEQDDIINRAFALES